jgi:hypothetical protein
MAAHTVRPAASRADADRSAVKADPSARRAVTCRGPACPHSPSGRKRVTGRPNAWSAGTPNTRSAAALNNSTVSWSSTATMASVADSISEARNASLSCRARSAFRCSVMSRDTVATWAGRPSGPASGMTTVLNHRSAPWSTMRRS